MQAKLANKKIIALTELTGKISIFGDANFLSLAACKIARCSSTSGTSTKLFGMRDGTKKYVNVPEIPGQLGPTYAQSEFIIINYSSSSSSVNPLPPNWNIAQ